ncbi:MAG: VWA domain-containing protein [Polyangiaceae bacterium]|nr:VWA domain-containing protein [Polyangiaceae bacterium]
MRLRHALLAALAALPAALALGAACSTRASTANVSTGSGGEGGLQLYDGGTGGDTSDAACAVYEETPQNRPVNLYVMFDKSSSMFGDKWNSAKAGLTSFVQDPALGWLRVALRFFPRDPDATPACDQFAYKEPTVPYGALPGAAADLIAAVDLEAPDGFSTPIYPALGGAILKGMEVLQASPTEASAVLLVTDGQPQGPAPTCGGVNPEDPLVIADLAAIGLAQGVATYVVGLPGVDQSFANTVAAAGGTETAILISAANVQAEFQQALWLIAGDAVPCEYDLPAQVISGEMSLGLVNIEVTPGNGGDPYLVPQNPACNGAGWTYDDPVDPTSIVLCPATCTAIKADMDVTVKVVLGCATIIL